MKEERQRLIRAVLGPVPKVPSLCDSSSTQNVILLHTSYILVNQCFLMIQLSNSVRVLEDPSDRSSPLVQLMDDRPSWLALSVEGKVLETLKKHGGIGKVRMQSNRNRKSKNCCRPTRFCFHPIFKKATDLENRDEVMIKKDFRDLYITRSHLDRYSYLSKSKQILANRSGLCLKGFTWVILQ